MVPGERPSRRRRRRDDRNAGEELSNPDESCVLYAIDMLEALDKRNLITPLLLHHESARVRARALLTLESARVPLAERCPVDAGGRAHAEGRGRRRARGGGAGAGGARRWRTPPR